MEKGFFDESTEQSRVKAAIVAKYFDAWAKVIAKKPYVDRIQYLDLFAGPGRYEDGTMSTPLKVLEKAIADPVLRAKLVAIFNDRDADSVRSLQRAISQLAGIELLTHAPQVWNEEVGDQMVQIFGSTRFAPTLFFVDPWGYKGLSLGLVNSVVKDWACECVFFFNYNRINMGLPNSKVCEHMNVLFGEAVADELRERLNTFVDPWQREQAIVENLCGALNPEGDRYVLPFTFKNASGNRTSHHLIFVSKHPLGYGIMKKIMAAESTGSEQGVPSFVYNPADKNFPVLHELSRRVEELQDMLMEAFAGQQLKVNEVFDRHNVGRPFILKNYRDAIIALEANHRVETSRTDAHRKRNQCPEAVTVRFKED